MADPVSASLMIAGGLQAGNSLAQGIFGAKADNTEAKALELQSKQNRLRASQIAHANREEFNARMSSLRAASAGRNVSNDSYGAMRVRQVARRRARNNENAQVLTEKQNEQALLNKAAARRRAAPFKIIAGIAGAGSSLASAYAADNE